MELEKRNWSWPNLRYYPGIITLETPENPQQKAILLAEIQTLNFKGTKKKTPWSESTSELYRPPDRLCDLVVRVLGYRSGGPGLIPGTTGKKK
jgi:hypothetical protein